MSPKIIPHVFGSLAALEKSIALIERQQLDTGSNSLAEIVSEMRRAANLIQLQFAKKDDLAAERSLRIFYGLLSMVRPIVIDTLREANGEKPYLEERRVQNLH